MIKMIKELTKEIKDEIERLEGIDAKYSTDYEYGYNDGSASVYRYVLSVLDEDIPFEYKYFDECTTKEEVVDKVAEASIDDDITASQLQKIMIISHMVMVSLPDGDIEGAYKRGAEMAKKLNEEAGTKH